MIFAALRTSMPHVLGDQAAQMLFVDSRLNQRPYLYQFRVHAFTEFAIFVQHISSRSPRAEVNVPVFTQHAADDAGHVFTAVVAMPFYYGNRPGKSRTPKRARPRGPPRTSIQATGGSIQQVLPIMLAL